VGAEDDADDLPTGPPPPPTERAWRHPSEVAARGGRGRGASRPTDAPPRRPGLWVVLTTSALIGTVVAVVVVGIVRQMDTDGARDTAAGADADPASASTLGDDVAEGRTLGPALTRETQSEHAWLGIEGTNVEDGVLVTAVVAASPAATAGLRPGDLIVAAERGAIDTMGELQAVIAVLRPGAVLVLDVIRSHDPLRLMAVLAVRS
jgi:hypothetical protein